MKEMLIIFLAAFAATAWVMDTGAPPRPQKIGMSGTTRSQPISNKKEDGLLGDFKLTDGERLYKLRSTVYDDDDPRASGCGQYDFPTIGGCCKI
jgi:hypothetical protein